jgi:hypothetical protein
MDLIYLTATVVLFASCFGLVRLCESVGGNTK